jgi:hypothetical protein
LRRTAVRLDNRPDDGEADAGAAAGPRACGVDAVEAFEDAVEVLGADPLAVVGARSS